MRQVWAVLAVAGLLAAGCGGDDGATPTSATDSPTTATPLRNGLVDIGGRSLHLECRGEGSPIVLFESGLGNDRNEWARVQNLVSDHTRACTYSRAGLGQSDPAPGGPRDARTMVDDLGALVETAGLDGPLVLVGASWGGMLVRAYAAEHAEDITGVVLVDSSHPNQIERFRQALTESMGAEQANALVAAALEDFARNPEGVEPSDTVTPELVGAADLGDLPLVVLVHGRPDGEFALPEIEATWQLLQQEHAELSTAGEIHVVPGAGHQIANEAPDAVVDAILSMIDSVP